MENYKEDIRNTRLGCHTPKKGNRTKSYNEGVLDIDFSCTTDKITFKAYKIFGAMFRRCNSPVGTKHNPAYHDCDICEDWHFFSNFLRWFKENYVEGYALDKDILVKGNRVYSPDTCCFVPIEINSLLTNRRNHRRLVVGVSETKSGRFAAHYSKKGKLVHLGTFKTKEEAFSAYKQAKEAYIKEVADEYYSKGLITKHVYDALYNWTIEITD